MFFFNNNSAFGNYTGRWYCNKCIASKKTMIPWKIEEKFNCKYYKVSKKLEWLMTIFAVMGMIYVIKFTFF